MKAVVLAAGRGTRMRPLTDTRPKPLLPVGESMLVEKVMDACAPHIDGYVVVVGYRGDRIRERVGDEYAGKPVEYVVQEERDGTGGAVALAEEYADRRFVVVNGDVFVSSEDVGRLTSLEENGISVKRVEDPSEYGVLEVRETDDGGLEATGIVEKPDEPPSELANAGIYLFEERLFDYLRDVGESERGERELTEAIGMMLDDGLRFGVAENDVWLDVGYPWDLLEANRLALEGIERDISGDVDEGVTLHGDVVVEEGATVREGACIEGPALVCEGASVGPNAYVRGATVVGEGAHVGHAVEVKNSLLMPGATAGHLAYVGDSVVGEDVNFGAGTVVANLRHDDESVKVQVKGEYVDTERRKFGVVVGDCAKTGINTSLNAGVRLGTGTTTKPGESVMSDRGVDGGK